MKDRRPLFVLAGMLALVLVIGGGLQLSDRLNAAKPSLTHDTTTTTIAASSSAPKDWRPLLDRVVAGENDLFKNPNPENVGLYMSQACGCYNDTKQRMTKLKANGWHVDGDVMKVSNATFVSGNDKTIKIYVQPVSGGNPTVDSNGKVVEEAPKGQVQLQIYELSKGADGVWRISDRRLPQELKP